MTGGLILKRGWLLLLLLFPFFSYAQTTRVNELLAKLKQPMPDTSRLRVLNDLGMAYITVDPAKKFYYATVAKALAEKINNGPGIADAYISMGISYGVRSKLDSALYYFTLAYDQSIKSKYELGIGKSLSDMGFAYDRLDNKQQAIKYYLRALTILKKTNYQKGINQCIINIGSIYYDFKQYATARSYFEQALKSYRASKDSVGIGYALFTIGNCYQALRNDDDALDYFTQSLVLRKKYGDVNGIGLTNRGLGEVYFHRKQYTKSLSHLDTAYKYISQLKDKYEQSAVLLDKADVFLELHKYDSAKTCANQALKLGKEIRSKIAVSESLEKLVSVYKNQGKIDIAFNYQTEYIKVLDSIEIEKSVKDVSQIELGRVRNENAALTKNNKVILVKNSNYAIVIVIVSMLLGIVILLLIFIYRKDQERKANNKLLTKQKEEIAHINHELEKLNGEISAQMQLTSSQNTELERLNDIKNKFFSIISHDLRGPIATMQTIFNFYNNGDIERDELGPLLMKLEDTILTTGTFLDNLLEWSKSQLDGIVIKPVIFNITDVIKENISLFTTQTSLKNIVVHNQADKDCMVYADRNMVNLVVRNLLSNGIKFCDSGDEISFGSEIKSGEAIISIRDTGPGINDQDLEKLFSLEHTLSKGTYGEKGNGLGLILCRDMLAQNNGRIWFETKPGEGTTFWISLPVKK